MKRLLLIVLPLFISVGFSQQIIHTETYDNKNIKSITENNNKDMNKTLNLTFLPYMVDEVKSQSLFCLLIFLYLSIVFLLL